MWYRVVADNENKTSGGMTSRRRRRLAAWLLVAWAMFWLVPMIQPCCQNLAVQGENASHKVAAQISSDAPKIGILDSTLPHDGFCQGLSAAEIIPLGTANAVTYRADFSFDTAPAAIVLAPRLAGVVIAYTPPAPPLSGAPLYLRHQRLLI